MGSPFHPMIGAGRCAASAKAAVVSKQTPSGDFPFRAQPAPSLFLDTPPDSDQAAAVPNHSPRFLVHKASMLVGMDASAYNIGHLDF